LSLVKASEIKTWCTENNVDYVMLSCVCCGQRLIDWRKVVMTPFGPIGKDCEAHGFPATRCHGGRRL